MRTLLQYAILVTLSFYSDSKGEKSESKEAEFDVISEIIKDLYFVPQEGPILRRFNFKFLGNTEKYSIDRSQRFVNGYVKIDLISYVYETVESAKEGFIETKNFKYIDSILKDYNYLFRSGNKMILVKTGCNQTKQAWNDLLTKIKSADIEIDEGLNCPCGGVCIDG